MAQSPGTLPDMSTKWGAAAVFVEWIASAVAALPLFASLWLAKQLASA
jgi:hypothetical protein